MEDTEVKIRLSLDRFEGDAKDIAVLLTDDGTPLNVPKRLLPRGVRAGDVLKMSFVRDVQATKQVADKTRQVQDALRKTDPGGDVKL